LHWEVSSRSRALDVEEIYQAVGFMCRTVA